MSAPSIIALAKERALAERDGLRARVQCRNARASWS